MTEEMKTLTIGDTTFKVVDDEAVHYCEQTLTDEQKKQACANIGAVCAEPDLVIGVNIQNTKYPPSHDFALSDMTEDDVTVESGSVAAAADKVRSGLPARVFLNEVHFYANDNWSRGIAEAIHVSVVSREYYPSETYGYLKAEFIVANTPGYGNRPLRLNIGFDIATGAVTNIKTGFID